MALMGKTLVRVLAVSVLAMAASVAAYAAQSASTSGEVRRVDAAGGRITIKHGAIKALDLTAMTLVYQTHSAALANIQPGDKITFTATREGETYVATDLKK